jgi:glutamine amidotransferase
MITIVDYNLGNVGSIKNMIEFLGFNDVEISSNHDRILNSTHLILPGVGSFDQGMVNLTGLGLDVIIKKYVLNLKKPLLGICLGMQLLGHSSEEGSKLGLGLIPFKNIKFKLERPFKIPHMGWNTVSIKQPHSPLLQGMDKDFRFYFVHSYHAVTENKENIILTTDYGYEIPVGVQQDQVYGVQFHPEKSHQFGKKLLDNFLRINHV